MEIYDVVMKLVGPVRPVGETHTDDKSFENLKVLVELTDKLLTDIDEIATDNKDRVEFSMNRAGKYCAAFYDRIGISNG